MCFNNVMNCKYKIKETEIFFILCSVIIDTLMKIQKEIM